MSVMERHDPPRHIIAREQYLRIHKRLVGPKTAERLFSLSQDLLTSPSPSTKHMAGWAAAEAALVAKDTSRSHRLDMLGVTETAWQEALTLQKQRWESLPITPNRSGEFKIRTDMVFLSAMQRLIEHRFDHETRTATFDALLALAIENAIEMNDAHTAGDSGRYGNHYGLAHEQTTLLAGNRLLSGRVFLMPSLARSGSGDNYPTQTHDIQVVGLRRGRFTTITPMEVKAKKIASNYSLPVVSAAKHLNANTSYSMTHLYEAFAKEREGSATPKELSIAQHATDVIFHLVTHHYRVKELGRQCLSPDKCLGRSTSNPQAPYLARYS